MSRSAPRLRWCRIVPFLLMLPQSAAGQRTELYRFVIGVDVPEPAVFPALDVAPAVRLGSAPKPVAAAIVFTHTAGETARAAALDFAPYWLAGGGARNLASYRSRSVAGRLMRVLTKTVLSVGAMHSSNDASAMIVAVGARSTLHDPHDPVLNSMLPEEAATAEDRELGRILARARDAMRARSWDPQVSVGWAVAARAAGGRISGDSMGAARHTAWLAAQLTAGRKFDLMGFAQVQDASGDERFFLGGLGLRRKSDSNDLQAGLAWDGRARALHPALLLDARLGSRIGTLLWIETRSDPSVAERLLRIGVLARWFAASDPVEPVAGSSLPR
jgi:hypothetical protein